QPRPSSRDITLLAEDASLLAELLLAGAVERCRLQRSDILAQNAAAPIVFSGRPHSHEALTAVLCKGAEEMRAGLDPTEILRRRPIERRLDKPGQMDEMRRPQASDQIGTLRRIEEIDAVGVHFPITLCRLGGDVRADESGRAGDEETPGHVLQWYMSNDEDRRHRCPGTHRLASHS